MMQNLLDAIKSFFTNNASGPLSGTITGGLFLNTAPEGTLMPYATYRLIGSPTTQTYVASFTEPMIDFGIVGVDAKDTLVLCEALRDAYAGSLLTLASGKMLNSILAMDPIPAADFPYKDEQARDCFEWIVSFRFSITG